MSAIRPHPGILVTLACGVILGGCFPVDGGPNWAASAIVVNTCDVPLDVKTRTYLDPADAAAQPTGARLVEPGSREHIVLAFRKPVPHEVFIYVAPQGAANFGQPHTLTTADLERYVDDDGYEVFMVVLADELCPR